EVFSVPIFLVTFREALETVLIVSVLLAFLKQTLSENNKPLYRKLVRQVYLGTVLGLLLTLTIAAILIALFYTLGLNHWESSELRYEGAFALIASVIISVVGAALLRMGRKRRQWEGKLASSSPGPSGAESPRFTGRYAMFVLPFVTVLREGIEAVVFIAGVSFSAPASAVPLPVVVGLAAGAVLGWVLYKSGSSTRLQLFLVVSTCLLYLVAAGLFSRAVWSFEQQTWHDLVGADVAEVGNGPGSYDIDNSVWHINCCGPYFNGGSGWGFFNAIFGWTNSATYGSVISYNLYWVAVIAAFVLMRYREVHSRWPLQKPK
ncbi:iron permease FTR1, partial [Trichocladium antarcticum]